MSDEKNPEIIDISLPTLPPLSTWELQEICAGLMVNIHDAAARSIARELLTLREQTDTIQ